MRPTSFMGATKRLCELLVLSLESTTTRYVAVRFGNVLGSNGSVIPATGQMPVSRAMHSYCAQHGCDFATMVAPIVPPPPPRLST